MSYRGTRRSVDGAPGSSSQDLGPEAPEVAPPGEVPVRVVVRCRPLLDAKCARTHIACEMAGSDETSLSIDMTRSQPRVFRCNAFCDEGQGQEDMFAHAAPVVDRVMEGYNGTIFCYGVTGSGKTYTMSGPPVPKIAMAAASRPTLEEQQTQGIVQRSAFRIFEFIRDRSSQGQIFAVEASFLEVYSSDGIQEALVDLLAGSGSKDVKLEVKQDPLNSSSFVCEGLRKVPIRSPDEMIEVLLSGRRRCTFMETSRNCLSSRSHCLFVVTIECLNESEDDARVSSRTGAAESPAFSGGRMSSSRKGPMVKRGKLVLVDLAGSESLKRVAAANEEDEGLRKRQAIGINRVLSHLGSVVNNLNIGMSSAAGHRNSALTMLLRDCLGGNARALLVANIGPEAEWLNETAMTLNFAQQMKQIRNVEKPTYIEQDKSQLHEMRQRHKECVERLQAKALTQAGATAQESEESTKLHREMEELNKRLLTKSSATDTLEQLRQEQNQRIDELRIEVARTMEQQFASLQEQSNRDLEGLRETFAAKASEGGKAMEQRQREVFQVQAGTLQAEIASLREARQVAGRTVVELRSQLTAAEQQVQQLQEHQAALVLQRAQRAEARRSGRLSADEQGTRFTDLVAEAQRYRVEASVNQAEAERLAAASAADLEALRREGDAWRAREAELLAEAQEAREQIEAQEGIAREREQRAERQHEDRTGESCIRIEQLEAEAVGQQAELEECLRGQVGLRQEAEAQKQTENELRERFQEDVRQKEDEIDEVQQRGNELLMMLHEVQNSIMHSTAG